MNALRTLRTWVTESPERSGLIGIWLVSALLFGFGFSLVVNAVRDADAASAPSASAIPTFEAWVPPSETSKRTTSPASEPLSSASAAATSPSAQPTPTVAPGATPTDEPAATPASTPAPPPSPQPVVGACADVVFGDDGTLLVDGEPVIDPWAVEYGEQMPMAILRLAARTDTVTAATDCLEVELPAVVVTGSIEICGDVVATRLEPEPTPVPAEPGPSMPPRYGEPTIAGVVISDRMLDINSYPLLDIADVVDAPACLHVASDANDVNVTLSLAICESARLDDDGTFTVFVGGREWSFAADYVFDDQEALPVGETVWAGLDLRNYRDDVRHLIEMAVWAQPGCPWDR